MALKAWVPAAGPVAELQREMNRLFDSVFGQHFGAIGRLRAGYVYPPMNVWETDEQYQVACEVPGLEMDDLEVSVTGDVLTIRGEKKDETVQKGRNYHRVERRYGSFTRSLTLPAPVNTDGVEAKARNGVLEIRLPKKEEVKPRRVEVKTE